MFKGNDDSSSSENEQENTQESKYKLVRKNYDGFCFGCGDVIKFRYVSLDKCLDIFFWESSREDFFPHRGKISKTDEKVRILKWGLRYLNWGPQIFVRCEDPQLTLVLKEGTMAKV